jgi:hypothetical protein
MHRRATCLCERRHTLLRRNQKECRMWRRFAILRGSAAGAFLPVVAFLAPVFNTLGRRQVSAAGTLA